MDTQRAWLQVGIIVLGLLVVGLATCCAGVATVVAVKSSIDVERVARQRSVYITVYCKLPPPAEDVQASSGSGVRIDARHVLTAYHVVDCPFEMTITITPPERPDAGITVTDDNRVQLTRGILQYAELELIDRRADLARLRLPFIDDTPRARVGEVDPGDVVCMANASPSPRYDCGTIRRDFDEHRGDLEHTMATLHGNSGSGLYDDRGRLVGIVVSKLDTDVGGRSTSLADHPWFFGGVL